MRTYVAIFIYVLLILGGFASAGLMGWIGFDLMSLAVRRRAARVRGLAAELGDA